MINKNGVHASNVSHGMCLMHVNTWPCALGGGGKPVGGTVPFYVSSQRVALTDEIRWSAHTPQIVDRITSVLDEESRCTFCCCLQPVYLFVHIMVLYVSVPTRLPV